MEVLKSFALVALGMLINQFYNSLMWKKFYEGRKDGRGDHDRKITWRTETPNGLPCKKECPDRIPGCHSHCKKYIEAKQKLDEKNTKIRAKRDAEIAVSSYIAHRVSEETKKPLKSR